MKEDIILKRKFKVDNGSYSNCYDLELLRKKEEENGSAKEQFLVLLVLIKKILLSSNDSYNRYLFNHLGEILFRLILNNLIYFIIIYPLFYFVSEKYYKKEQQILIENLTFWKMFLLINIPKLIVVVFQVIIMHNKDIQLGKLMNFFNEKYIYKYNSDNNYYICKINNNNFDIHLFERKKYINNQNKKKNLYINSTEFLSKEAFYENVIIYSSKKFYFINQKMLNLKESEMISKIFEFLVQIELKIKKETKIFTNSFEIVYNFINISAYSFNYVFSFILKLVTQLIEELYFNKNIYLKQKKKQINQQKDLFNQNNIKNGYFLEINEDFIMLYRLKKKYYNYDEYYKFLCKESNKIIDYFKI